MFLVMRLEMMFRIGDGSCSEAVDSGGPGKCSMDGLPLVGLLSHLRYLHLFYFTIPAFLDIPFHLLHIPLSLSTPSFHHTLNCAFNIMSSPSDPLRHFFSPSLLHNSVPWIISHFQIIKDPNNLRITTKLNGQTVQDSTTKDMIFNVKKIINFISQGTTLLPGDVIMTGTPQGMPSHPFLCFLVNSLIDAPPLPWLLTLLTTLAPLTPDLDSRSFF